MDQYTQQYQQQQQLTNYPQYNTLAATAAVTQVAASAPIVANGQVTPTATTTVSSWSTFPQVVPTNTPVTAESPTAKQPQKPTSGIKIYVGMFFFVRVN